MSHNRMLWTRAAAVVRLAVAAFAAVGAASARATDYAVAGVTTWKTNAAPRGWSASLDRIFYDAKGADGMFDAYSANPDGSDPRCITCTIPSFPTVGTATQRGVQDVSPDGNLILLEVERGEHSGQVGASIAEPGKGTYNDIWLARADGSQAWPLTDLTAPGQTALGTMWARFDRTGTKIVWAELYSPAVLNLGYWRLKVADIVWSSGVPQLANVRAIEPQPNHFYEPYGFSPDDSHIIFASDLGMPSWMDSQIYSIGIDGSGLTRLSPDDGPTGMFTNYNEFAWYTPANDWIIYGRTINATQHGLDYWMMRPDGSESRRLTYFNEPWHSEYRGYSVTGGLAFDPNNPDRFVAAVASDLAAENFTALMVTLAPVTAGRGLQAQYFAQTNLTQQVMTRTENPSEGFRWDGPPTPGLPSSGFSVRWSGSVASPVSGNYTYCVTANDGARLWVGSTEVIDGWWVFGNRTCGTIDQTAGSWLPIRLEYWNGLGTGYIQLVWTPPGGSAGDGARAAGASAQMIPAADLLPSAPAGWGGAGPSGSASSGKTTTRSQPTKRRPPARWRSRSVRNADRLLPARSTRRHPGRRSPRVPARARPHA
jgi:hypothetical protein